MPRIERAAATLQKIAALEKRLDQAETDAAWDAMGKEIAQVERELSGAIAADEETIDAERTRFQRSHNVFARAFSPAARREWRDTVGASRDDLESVRGGEARLHQLKARFYDDKMRVHARAFLRVAEKVERHVAGSFEEKAAAAAGRWLAGKTGDEALDVVAAFREAAPRLRGDAGALLAALLSLDAPADAARRADATAARLDDDALVGAALLSRRSPDDAAAVLEALRASAALPKEADAAALVAGAALLSQESASSSAATLVAMSRSVPAMWDGPAPVIAAAILAGRKPDDALAFADEVTAGLAGAEGCSSIIAAGLLAGRSAADTVRCARTIDRSVAGSSSARAAIAAAGVLSGRPAEEAIAFAHHVQGKLPGSWEDEATIVCAGLLGAPDAPAPEAIRLAFALPGLVRPNDED